MDIVEQPEAGKAKVAYSLMMHEQQPSFLEHPEGSNGEVMEDIWGITPVKRGMYEVGRKGEEDRNTCDTRVNVGTVGQATNSGVSEEQCM
jgi:hypothetical protein